MFKNLIKIRVDYEYINNTATQGNNKNTNNTINNIRILQH